MAKRWQLHGQPRCNIKSYAKDDGTFDRSFLKPSAPLALETLARRSSFLNFFAPPALRRAPAAIGGSVEGRDAGSAVSTQRTARRVLSFQSVCKPPPLISSPRCVSRSSRSRSFHP
eukprot:6180651-Pleurochrysis_carterae.AAC.2